jgi:long-subunit acyl-CoA synthetase (AMP-forming)
MSAVIDAIRRHAHAQPAALAVADGAERLSYAGLLPEVERVAQRLAAAAPNAIGLLADNSLGWVVTDLAAMLAGMPITPLPLFASAAQIAHTLAVTGIDYLVTDRQADLCAALPPNVHLRISPLRSRLFAVRLTRPPAARTMPPGCWKVTFTSGTTGDPKGVCLSRAMIERTADALARAGAGTSSDRHLAVLPLATLLENVGGVYAPLIAGASACVPSLASVGLSGSSGLDVARLVASLGEWRATSAILVPEMLAAIVGALERGAPPLRNLRFLAVGGAPTPGAVLEKALALGLPVFEGYGLSECASVVAVNRPGASRPGSVGRPLPHVRIEIARDSEILVHDAGFLGYLGDTPRSGDGTAYATGDLGYVDDAGYVHVTGRKKSIFVTSFGRNVAPEWVERELTGQPSIGQAAVFGEARPFNAAVIVPDGGAGIEAVSAAIDAANRNLPDYARVAAWILASEPFSSDNGFATPNGRLRRHAILRRYGTRLDALYETKRASNA